MDLRRLAFASRTTTGTLDARVASSTLGGRHRRSGFLAAYASFLGVAGALIVAAVRLGGRGGDATGAAQAVLSRAKTPGGSAPVATWHVLGVIVGIVVLCRAGGWLATMMRQPVVIGEVVTGVLLGPSLLGIFTPGLLARVLPTSIQSDLALLSNIGVTLFAFGLGLDLDWRSLRRRAGAAVWVSHVSIALPFVSGCFVALLLTGAVGPQGPFAPYCLFLGTAMSITALPVLGRIVDETGLRATPLGQLAVLCAALDDITAWVILSFVMALARGHGSLPALRTIVLGAGMTATVLAVIKPALARMADRRYVSSVVFPAALALTFGALSDFIGLHAIFGAFLVGCAVPRSGAIASQARRLSPVTDALLLPIFFVTAGLSVDLRALFRHPGQLGLGCVIFAVALTSKLGGAALAGRWAGLGRREALELGVLMNARGLTELIVLQVGLQLGVIPRALYTLLVLMALMTTVVTAPLLRALRRGGPSNSASPEFGPGGGTLSVHPAGASRLRGRGLRRWSKQRTS